MTFIQHYDSPLGGILLAADEIGLTGLWFDGEKYFADNLPFILRAVSHSGFRRCTQLALHFVRPCGGSFCRFLTDRP